MITTSRTEAATIEQLKAAFATAKADVAKACEYAFNCEDASVDDDGDIWIENPQRGHWLSDEEIEHLVNHIESEVGTSIFDWLGTKGCVAALKVDGVTQPEIAEQLGITLSALEKKVRGANPTTMLETKALIQLIADQAQGEVTTITIRDSGTTVAVELRDDEITVTRGYDYDPTPLVDGLWSSDSNERIEQTIRKRLANGDNADDYQIIIER